MIKGTVLQSRHCLICESDDKKVVYPLKLPQIHSLSPAGIHYQYHSEVKGNNWHFLVAQCNSCGHKFADKIFDQSTIEGSYLNQKHDNEFELDPKLLQLTNDLYAQMIEPNLPANRDLQIDVGCDTGNFIRSTKRFGFKRVVGIEPGVDSAKKAAEIPGVEVMQKVFDPNDFADKSIDFASLVHVLDHLVDSKKFLQSIGPKMKPGGRVFAVVHNVASLISKISRENWAPYNLVHMEYFQPNTLAKLFEQEGYHVIGVYPTANVFPLSHLIRFAPYIPEHLRKAMLWIAKSWLFRKIVLKIKLGNIAIIAVKK